MVLKLPIAVSRTSQNILALTSAEYIKQIYR